MRDFAAVLVSVASVITALSLRFGTLNRGVRMCGGVSNIKNHHQIQQAGYREHQDREMITMPHKANSAVSATHGGEV